MPNASVKTQVVAGFRSVINVLIFISVAGLFFGSASVVYTAEGHLSVGAWLSLGVSTVFIIATENLWAKALPGVLIYGTIVGLILLVGGPSIHNSVSRFEATIFTAYLAVCAYLSRDFENRKLTLVDRWGLAIFLFSLAWMIARDSGRIFSTGAKSAPIDKLSIAAMMLGTGSLVVTWVCDRMRRE